MQSETVGALAAALAKAQGQIRPAPMDRDNPFFKSKYATLTSLWESARTALAANGLAVTQATDLDSAGNIVLITTLLHSSGEWVGSVYPVRPKDNAPQTLGSALTYARRYAFGALVGLSSDDDDDGNAANGNGGNHAPAKQQEVRPANKPAAPVAATISGGSQNVNGNGGGVVVEHTNGNGATVDAKTMARRYQEAKDAARKANKFNGDRHLDNAWAEQFKLHNAHDYANGEAFLAAWAEYVADHADAVKRGVEDVPAVADAEPVAV